jgi:hypothetical protein
MLLKIILFSLSSTHVSPGAKASGVHKGKLLQDFRKAGVRLVNV